jgi:hypothetical protein
MAVERVDGHILLVTPERVFHSVQIIITVAQLIPCVAVMRISFDKIAEQLNGVEMLTNLFKKDPLVEQGILVGGIEFQGPVICLESVFMATEFVKRDSPVDVQFGVGGIEVHRAIKTLQRLLVTAQTGEDGSLALPGLGTVRGELEKTVYEMEGFVKLIVLRAIADDFLQRVRIGRFRRAIPEFPALIIPSVARKIVLSPLLVVEIKSAHAFSA